MNRNAHGEERRKEWRKPLGVSEDTLEKIRFAEVECERFSITKTQ
ncbi:hypothetical protein T4D_7898 [Trichinella pseudospiralis]|uniref:Uncharacterized protein n=1 Tax=Trichinella pseudospiralis TaxID=6337 RepID=A0A0V1EXU9_TRIPS|nr:hypothetical protein T4D_7898 [Trichinella pseudospiralis]